MDISFLLVICNTVVFTLIWLVQLVIYPSFMFYNELDLKRWHPRYTRIASLITAPIMLVQVILYSIVVLNKPSLYSIGGLVLVGISWLMTFFVAIPLHQAIDRQIETIVPRQKLVRVNWVRTIAWTGSFMLCIIEYGK